MSQPLIKNERRIDPSFIFISQFATLFLKSSSFSIKLQCNEFSSSNAQAFLFSLRSEPLRSSTKMQTLISVHNSLPWKIIYCIHSVCTHFLYLISSLRKRLIKASNSALFSRSISYKQCSLVTVDYYNYTRLFLTFKIANANMWSSSVWVPLFILYLNTQKTVFHDAHDSEWPRRRAVQFRFYQSHSYLCCFKRYRRHVAWARQINPDAWVPFNIYIINCYINLLTYQFGQL